MRIAMPGEVLRHRQNPTHLEPTSISKGTRSDVLRGGTKATCTDYRIFGVNVHIHYWGKVDVNAHELALPCYLCPIGLYQLEISSITQTSITRILWSIFQAHIQPPFTIQSDK